MGMRDLLAVIRRERIEREEPPTPHEEPLILDDARLTKLFLYTFNNGNCCLCVIQIFFTYDCNTSGRCMSKRRNTELLSRRDDFFEHRNALMPVRFFFTAFYKPSAIYKRG